MAVSRCQAKCENEQTSPGEISELSKSSSSPKSSDALRRMVESVEGEEGAGARLYRIGLRRHFPVGQPNALK